MHSTDGIRLNVDLSPYNAYGLTSRCARAFFPNTEEDVHAVFAQYPERKKILIGSGHNIILAREYYDEDFLIFNGNLNRIGIADAVMDVQAGAFSSRMSEIALEQGLSGLEVFYDIPSSLGGAVVMNAGASGEEIKELVLDVRYLDCTDLQIRSIPACEAEFSYRDSLFQRDSSKVVLGARLQLRPERELRIREKMNDIKAARWAKQPRHFPNAGSVFKRPAGRFVGPMIEGLGLKGFAVGGVSISEKHAGFIVRHGEANGGQLLALIEHVKRRVLETHGVDLEVEQRIIL